MRTFIFLLLLICMSACQPASQFQEQSFVELGGEKQYIEINAMSSDDPVLLFIHGGPGWPQTPHLRYFNGELTKHTVLVAWEQSGCGKSMMSNPDPKNLSLEQIVNDAHELAQLLKKKFNRDKIYVAGFSWGSIVGLKLVEKYPEDYHAYFGISQVISVRENIKVSRQWIAEQAKAVNDTPTLSTLAKIENRDTSVCKSEWECFFQQYLLLSKYHGAIYKQESEAEIEKAVTAYDDYKNYDWMAGFNYSISKLQNDLFTTDLFSIKEIKVPAYFFVGRHDWNIPASVTERFVSNLKAPKKEMVWFEESGHEPLEEEASRFNEAIIDRIRQ